MKKWWLWIGFICLFACKERTVPVSCLPDPQNYTVFLDGDSLCSLDSFLPTQEKVIIGWVNMDCSACILKASLWLNFAKKHPGWTSVLVVSSEVSRKVFWADMQTYFSGPLYVVFDSKEDWAKVWGQEESPDTWIVNPKGEIILKGNITDKSFKSKLEKLL